MSLLGAAVVGVVSLPPLFDMTAIVVGALSGAAHGARAHLDPVGVFVVALVTGVGGGALRDILLERGVPAFLFGTNYLAYAVLAAVVGYLFAGLIARVQAAFDLVDTLLIGLWVVIGAQKALLLQLSPVGAVFLGVVTATGGGVLRDVLLRRPPQVFTPGQVYALAAVVGALVFVPLYLAGVVLPLAIAVTVAVTTTLRLVSLDRGWRTPPSSAARLGGG